MPSLTYPIILMKLHSGPKQQTLARRETERHKDIIKKKRSSHNIRVTNMILSNEIVLSYPDVYIKLGASHNG